MADGLSGVRSILETPILEPRKWAKVPSLPCDAVLLDLEDSVPPDRKAEARKRVLQALDEVEQLGGRIPIPRVNGLDTPWGRDDLEALATRDVNLVCYPKVRTADELHEVCALLDASSTRTDLFVIVETAQAVLELEKLAQVPRVAGFVLGPYDLAVSAGWELFADGKLFADPYHYPKSKLVLVGASYGLPVFDTVFVPDLRDFSRVQVAARQARQLGFSGMVTFYPPHLALVNEVFTSSEEEIAAAQQIVASYENVLANGGAAARSGGQVLIVQDYKRALHVLGRWQP